MSNTSLCSRCGYTSKNCNVRVHIKNKKICKPILNNDLPILISKNTTICDICDTEISNNNYAKHRNACIEIHQNIPDISNNEENDDTEENDEEINTPDKYYVDARDGNIKISTEKISPTSTKVTLKLDPKNLIGKNAWCFTVKDMRYTVNLGDYLKNLTINDNVFIHFTINHLAS